jgi:hypothetical protein
MLSRTLYEKLKEAAEAGGYSSAEEFALHVLETAVAGIGDEASEEEVRERLRGLGYLE